MDAGWILWRITRRRNLWLWMLFLAWSTIGFRLLVFPGLSWIGLLDDVTLLMAGLGTFAVLDRCPRLLRLPAMTVLGFTIAAFNFCNALFFEFFESVLNLDSYHLLSQVEGAATSINVMFTPRVITLFIAMPILLLALGLWSSAAARPRRMSRAVKVALATVLASSGVHAAAVHEEFLVNEHNGLMSIVRQGVERVETLYGNPQDRYGRIAETLAQTYNLPPPEAYLTGVDARFPLMRVPRVPTAKAAQPYNVVLVLMESFRLREAGIGRSGDGPNVAPHLRALAEDALLFTQFYANGHQTVRGEMATLCGTIPNYKGGQIYSTAPELALPCLPDVLARNGYETHWISSYSASYGNKREFLTNHGIQHVHDDKELKRRPLKRPKMGWGPADEDLAEFAVDVLDRAKAPFFAEVMTLSNHHPFNANFGIDPPAAAVGSPEGTTYKNYLRGLHYTDHAVKYFLDLARSRPWFKNTVFIILGDHGIWLFPERGPRPLTPAERIESYYRTPLMFYAPGIITPGRKDFVASQVDLAPTVLDLLGITATNAFQGVSLLQELPDEERFAVMGNDAGWSIRQGNRYCYAMGMDCFTTMAPFCPKGYEPRPAGHACFQTDADLLDGVERFDTLDERDAARLVARGRRIVDNNSFLLLHDAFVPPSVVGPSNAPQ